jgi:hypothetical protein
MVDTGSVSRTPVTCATADRRRSALRSRERLPSIGETAPALPGLAATGASNSATALIAALLVAAGGLLALVGRRGSRAAHR